jgi:transposase InsO family protein
VLFERICRENGITQRLTKPRSPTTGKIERLHQTLQLELLNVRGPFASMEDAQAAVDAWRKDYNTARPHQCLNMAFPRRPVHRPSWRRSRPADTRRADRADAASRCRRRTRTR